MCKGVAQSRDLSPGPHQSSRVSATDFQSPEWTHMTPLHGCSLEFCDRISDSFYDVWGDFGAELGRDNAFPNLADLLNISPADHDSREVCSKRPGADYAITE